MEFAIFDIETRVDKRLLNESFFAGQGLSDQGAFERFRAKLKERYGNDFPPLTLHVPVSIAIARADGNYVLKSVETLALGGYSEERLCRGFWQWLESFAGTLVSFNGRRFDIPVMELQALRYGLVAHVTDNPSERPGDLDARHIDLYDLLSRRGEIRLQGGLDVLLRMIGMPGKGSVSGRDVQRMFEAGRLEEIHRYCREDVVRTYFLFIRVALMRGWIDEKAYNRAHEAAAPFAAQSRARAGGADG